MNRPESVSLARQLYCQFIVLLHFINKSSNLYRNLVNFRTTDFSILIVRCGYFCCPTSPTNYYHHVKKHLTTTTCLPGHREQVMKDVREHEAASCICCYRKDHLSTSDTLKSDVLILSELRNEAAQLSQDSTVPSFTVEVIISNFTFSLSQLTTNLFDIEK